MKWDIEISRSDFQHNSNIHQLINHLYKQTINFISVADTKYQM